MNWDTPHQICKSSFALEMLHEGGVLDQAQSVYRNAARHIHPACRKHLHREIARLTGQDRNEKINGCRTQLAAIAINGSIDDHERRIVGGGHLGSDFGLLRNAFDVSQIPVDIRNPNSRTYVLKLT